MWPLLFSWATLTADHLKRFMQVDEHGTQLYMASMLNLLRGLQRQAKMPAFADFLRLVDAACDVKSQSAPLRQRLNLLKSIVRESSENQPLAHLGLDLADISIAGKLVIVDLTDPLLSSLEANGIFQVLVEQFHAVPLRGCGKVLALALDEAHKFMRGDGDGDGLSHARWPARRVACTGARAARVSVCAMHRFHSRDWCKYLAQKLVESALPLSAVFKMRVRQRLTADGPQLTHTHRPAQAQAPAQRKPPAGDAAAKA